MARYSSSDIGEDDSRVYLDLVSKIVDNFEGGFATYWSEVGLLEYDVLVIDRTFHSGWR